ncbi:MAG: RNA-directed DNA polymerase, partial [Inquilinus sp.]|nr:RNA-directed DNA polymerase [Inquilinus sp.]
LPPELDWFADTRRQHGVTEKRPLQHYSYAWVPKRRGAPRLIEAPKPRLKALQRQILRDILDRIPVHEAAHGFVKGRSCLGGAARHGGEAVVATLDLADFFPSVPLERVHGIFRCLGYPTAVARLLTGLCSTTTPRGVLAAAPGVKRPPGAFVPEAAPHLPQGAPTSPALANLSANRLDARLDQLAEYAGARYTRYADDLAFSGDDEFAAGIGSFLATVEEIIRAERFAPNRRKTRIMRRAGRQQVTGLVVNQHLNVPRPDYDRLKAILHNCARHGPAGQNRDGHPDFRAHLDGRVGWVQTVNPHRGLKLRLLFEAIAW